MNEFDVEFLLKLIKKLSVGRDFTVHVLDEVTNVGIEGHGHVVGKVVGDAFSFKMQIVFFSPLQNFRTKK